MSNEETPRWWGPTGAAMTARADACQRFAELIADGEDVTAFDADHAAHEYADGDGDVIYVYRARALYFDAVEVQECEDEARGLLDPGRGIDARHQTKWWAPGAAPEPVTVDRVVAACVYIALRNEWERTFTGLVENLDVSSVIEREARAIAGVPAATSEAAA